MHEMLKFALNTANSNLSTDQKIHEVFISSTNNGLHNSNSNHYRNKAIDISRINGVRMTHMNASQLAAAYALQEAFENHSNIRENFGPKFNHKNGQDFTVNTHRDHIHVSSNDCN